MKTLKTISLIMLTSCCGAPHTHGRKTFSNHLFLSRPPFLQQSFCIKSRTCITSPFLDQLYPLGFSIFGKTSFVEIFKTRSPRVFVSHTQSCSLNSILPSDRVVMADENKHHHSQDSIIDLSHSSRRVHPFLYGSRPPLPGPKHHRLQRQEYQIERLIGRRRRSRRGRRVVQMIDAVCARGLLCERLRRELLIMSKMQ